MTDVIRTADPKYSRLLHLVCFIFGHNWRLIQTPPPQPLIWHCERCNWEGPSS